MSKKDKITEELKAENTRSADELDVKSKPLLDLIGDTDTVSEEECECEEGEYVQISVKDLDAMVHELNSTPAEEPNSPNNPLILNDVINSILAKGLINIDRSGEDRFSIEELEAINSLKL